MAEPWSAAVRLARDTIVRLERPLAVLSVLCVAGSLLARVVIRGRYYAGWEVIPAAHGAFLLPTRPPLDVLASAVRRGAYYGTSIPMDSLPCALLPGYLARLWPWEAWGHLVTFVLVVVTIALIPVALGLPRGRRWIVVLAWGASPALR